MLLLVAITPKMITFYVGQKRGYKFLYVVRDMFITKPETSCNPMKRRFIYSKAY